MSVLAVLADPLEPGAHERPDLRLQLADLPRA